MSDRVVRLTRALVCASLLAVAAACGQGAVDNTRGAPGVAAEPTGVDPSVLNPWADFPVTRKPRLILLIGQTVLETGYHTNDAKLAVATGRLQLDAALPKAPATVPTRLAEGTYHLDVITAEQAYETLRAVGKPDNAAGASPAPLRITAVTLGTATFLTDRGPRPLPAWLFASPDSFEPLAVLALSGSALWRPGQLHNYPDPRSHNTLAADGVTLTVMLPAPSGCAGRSGPAYVADVLESATAVAVDVRAEPSTPPSSRPTRCVSDLVARSKTYTVRLAEPLGNRVVVGPEGAVVPIVIN